MNMPKKPLSEERVVRISKYLSKHLRHQPERIGLTLEAGGWVGVQELLDACRRNQFSFTRDELDEVVSRNDKKRFSFSEDGTQIRANQGHSVEVDLELEPATPPEVLYHGTGASSVQAILQDGLTKQRRHHVHLSRDVETAVKVGARHGRPVVFAIDTRAMTEAGHTFYVSANDVWLVDTVPPGFLTVVKQIG